MAEYGTMKPITPQQIETVVESLLPKRPLLAERPVALQLSIWGGRVLLILTVLCGITFIVLAEVFQLPLELTTIYLVIGACVIFLVHYIQRQEESWLQLTAATQSYEQIDRLARVVSTISVATLELSAQNTPTHPSSPYSIFASSESGPSNDASPLGDGISAEEEMSANIYPWPVVVVG